MICIFMILGKGLVSDEDAACAPGVKFFFVHYCYKPEELRNPELRKSVSFIEILNQKSFQNL